MARAKKKRSRVYVISVVAHLAVGAALALIPQERLREVMAIALNETKEEKKPEPPKPPPHAPEAQPRGVTHNERPTQTAHAPAATATDAPGFADIGLALDSTSNDGIAVNIAPPAAAVLPEPVAPARPKVLVPRRVEAACPEDPVKARPLALVRPSYTDAARQARVQGRVVIEIIVDEHGEASSVRLVKGLGYGLDEAALEAAKRLHFSPATRCNRPVGGPFLLGMRFALPQ